MGLGDRGRLMCELGDWCTDIADSLIVCKGSDLALTAKYKLNLRRCVGVVVVVAAAADLEIASPRSRTMLRSSRRI